MFTFHAQTFEVKIMLKISENYVKNIRKIMLKISGKYVQNFKKISENFVENFRKFC